ncbi:MAG TPA: sulfotransferase, partial [Methylomirabilota bacterium]|nr:sulfotransferase [Methylomirabilota bacterium]
VRIAEGRLDEAAAAEQAALAADPRQARAHWALAELAHRRGDPAAERRERQEFARLAPRSYDAWRVREALAAARGD